MLNNGVSTPEDPQELKLRYSTSTPSMETESGWSLCFYGKIAWRDKIIP